MASIYRRGRVWYVKWQEHGRWRYRSLETTKKADALAEKRAFEGFERAHSKASKPAGQKGRLTLADLAVLWNEWAGTHRRPRTKVNLHRAIHTFRRIIGPREIRRITEDDVREFQRLRREQVSAATVNLELTHLCAVVGRGVRQSWYEGSNPFAGVERLPQASTRIRWLSSEEIAALVEVAKFRSWDIALVVHLGIYAGLRKAEISHARWDWVDGVAGLVHVTASEYWQPKANRARTIPLHDALRAFLDGWDGSRDGYIGRPENPPQADHLYRWDFTRTFAKVAAAAGVPWCTPHTLRHTFASQLVSAGVSLHKVSVWLGHADYATTRIYAHLKPADQDINKF